MEDPNQGWIKQIAASEIPSYSSHRTKQMPDTSLGTATCCGNLIETEEKGNVLESVCPCGYSHGKIVNLTPHPVVVAAEPYHIKIGGCDEPARVGIDVTESGATFVCGLKIRTQKERLGKTATLPPKEPGTIFIVSRIVAESCPDRDDVYYPCDLIRDSHGEIVGANALGRPSMPSTYV